MKHLGSFIVRALCAIVVGALLVKYRSEMVTWMTIAIGVLFFLSGVISVVAYFAARRQPSDVEVYDAEGRLVAGGRRPMFPIVGLGSIILGVILALIPDTFTNGLVYVLAALLILGAIGQFFGLASILRHCKVGFFWWLVPSLLLILGIVAVVRPQTIAAAPLFVIGWAMMVYGVVELINGIKISAVMRQVRKAEEAAAAEEEAARAAAAQEELAQIPQETAQESPTSAEEIIVLPE
ncbi:MAG: DUF308 domain-containing protein [Prevotella sp.]|nr:DUF308 domain-containing protein [Prevotella sp.]